MSELQIAARRSRERARLSWLAALRSAASCARRIARYSIEIVPSEARALEREPARSWTRTHVEEADGFERLRAYLPPPERRALVLIDPPYEERRDFDAVTAACQEALRRLRSAVIAAWYPIKDARTTEAWLHTRAAQFDCDNVVSEWWLYPRDSRVALEWLGAADPESALSICRAHAYLAGRTARDFSTAREPAA